MYNVAICDDKDDIRVQLSEQVQKTLKRKNQNCIIETFYDGSGLINFMEKGNSFDIIFLDIEMEFKSGIDVGIFLRHELKNHSTEIASISGSNLYDRKLFNFQPIAFLPKPITDDMISEAIDLLFLRNEKHSFYSYKVNRDLVKVPISEILYFKSDDRKINIITISVTDSFYGKIFEEEKRLAEHGFVLVNRCTLVNFNHIKLVSASEILLSDGSAFKISRYRE